MNKIFDSHAHYDDDKFNQDREAILSEMTNKNVCGIINCGIDIESSLASIKLAEKYPFIWAAIGIHPHEAEKAEDNFINQLTQLSNNSRVVAIGEIGLDYYYDLSPRNKQIEIFEKQIVLSKELDLPIIIHDREAHHDTLNLLKKYRPKGVVHCFSGSVEMANELTNLNLYIGIGGAVTFKNAKKPIDVIKNIDLNYLLLETDCPYMTPVPFRGKRCDSSFITYTAEKIAEIRGISIDKLLLKTKQNAENLFSIEVNSK